jgi:hypothetical protein
MKLAALRTLLVASGQSPNKLLPGRGEKRERLTAFLLARDLGQYPRSLKSSEIVDLEENSGP